MAYQIFQELKPTNMNMIIPTIMLLAIIVISYQIYKEYKKRKRIKSIQEYFEQEQMFIIEQKVMRDIKERAEWWDNFNIDHYVKFLENR